MSHPWVKHRSRVGFTQLEVAEYLMVTRQYVIRLEQSLFHEPPGDILLMLAQLYTISPGELAAEYGAFVKTQREEFRSEYQSFKEVLTEDYRGLVHPLKYYRESQSLSRMAFCKGLCLDYGPISDYETNKQRAIPMIIKLAAEEVNWNYEPLELAVKNWRRDGRADRGPKQNSGGSLLTGTRVRH